MPGRYVRGRYQYFDRNNPPNILAGGKIFFFASNSSGEDNFKNVFADPDGNIPLTNPVILDGSGMTPEIFLEGAYKEIVTDKNDVQISEADPVTANENNIRGFGPYNAITIYNQDDIVRADNGRFYLSQGNNNQNNEPSISPSEWIEVLFLEIFNLNKTYSLGNIVLTSDGFLFRSRVNDNLGNDPNVSPTEWGDPTALIPSDVIQAILDASADVVIDNNLSYSGRNVADDGQVDLIKVNISDLPELGTGAVIPSPDIDNPDIDGGTIDGANITGGSLNSTDINSPDIDGGTIDGTAIGATTPSTIVATTINATSISSDTGFFLDNDVSLSGRNFADTADLALIKTNTSDLPELGANAVIPSPDIDNADIDGSTIDSSVIGGTTPAAISGTTGTFSGDVLGNKFLAADGSVSSPTHSFASAPNLGLFLGSEAALNNPNIFAVAINGSNRIGFAEWTSADTDIAGLIPGTPSGALILAEDSRHIAVGLRENDGADSFNVISGAGDFSTDDLWDLLAFQVRADGASTFNGTLAINGTSTVPLAVTGPTSCEIVSEGLSGFGSYRVKSSGSNEMHLFFENVNNGERARITGTSVGGMALRTGSSLANAIVMDVDRNVSMAGGDLTVEDGITELKNTANVLQFSVFNQDAAFTTKVAQVITTRAAGTAFDLLHLVTEEGVDNIVSRFRADGTNTADVAWNGGGADVGEYYEYLDGNSNGEPSRVGMSVVLVGDKIRLALPGEIPFGVISVTAGIVINADLDYWKGRDLRNDLGELVYEEYTVTEWIEVVPAVTKDNQRSIQKIITEEKPIPGNGNGNGNGHTVHVPIENIEDVWVKESISPEGVVTPRHIEPRQVDLKETIMLTYEDGSPVMETITLEEEKKIKRSYMTDRVPEGLIAPDNAKMISVDHDGNMLTRRKQNPDYDPTTKYISREDRPEWAVVGILGRLRVLKGQPVNPRWKRMKQISDTVDEYSLCVPTD